MRLMGWCMLNESQIVTAKLCVQFPELLYTSKPLSYTLPAKNMQFSYYNLYSIFIYMIINDRNIIHNSLI